MLRLSLCPDRRLARKAVIVAGVWKRVSARKPPLAPSPWLRLVASPSSAPPTGRRIHIEGNGTPRRFDFYVRSPSCGRDLIYADAYVHREELSCPYSAVTDINPKKLPDGYLKLLRDR